MAALIDEAFGVQTHCVEGRRGEFTVVVDGTRVASKRLGEFPTETECIAAVAAHLNPDP